VKAAAVSAKRARELLGRRLFFSEARRRTSRPGVATGLAWTPVGGEVLFIEATSYPGSGKLQITGQLGDVMRESASTALSWAKANVRKWGADVPAEWWRENDIHLHVPAGAIPKDGPSAGLAMATALVSLVTRRPVRPDVAMTGEIDLIGQALPIGGLKEKSLAAQRAGISCVIAPKLNEPDLDDIPPQLRRGLEFKFVDSIDKVLEVALEPEKGAARKRSSGSRDGRASARKRTRAKA
jgi:ATP-dependent Lon protease